MSIQKQSKVKDTQVQFTLNYMRLWSLLNTKAVSTLRQMFTDQWKFTTNSVWTGTPDDGEKFLKHFGKTICKPSQVIQKQNLASGNIQTWDLPLLVNATNCLHDGNGISRQREQEKCFDILKKIRNELAHQGNSEVDNEKFEEYWTKISEVLQQFGVPKKELEELKKITLLNDQTPKRDTIVNDINTEEAKQLKKKGNNLYAEQKYWEAIHLYSEGINLPGIPLNDLAILYSNRSIAYFKIKQFNSAKEDAKGAVHLRPTWSRGYTRLGQAYQGLDKYELALKNFSIAYSLEPSDAVKDNRDYCRLIVGQKKREEHLDPMSLEGTMTFDETAELMNKELGTSRTGEQLEENIKLNNLMGLPVGMCGEGHKYAYGRGVAQDYEIAAKYYSKAASQGNAEGMYNLAILMRQGKGVQRNIPGAIQLFEQAASQDIATVLNGHRLPNLGVFESEHVLGLSYSEGIGVDQDYGKALYWYTRAIKHGSAASANNVALMYSRGQGGNYNREMAIQYWRLAASRKLVRAIENLALEYLESSDVENAQKWFVFGIQNGSITLGLRKNDFEFLVGSILDNQPFDLEEFESKLVNEVRNGPLKHLIVDDLPSFFSSDFKSMCTSFGDMQTSRKDKGLSDPYRILIITMHRLGMKNMQSRGDKHAYEANAAKLRSKLVVDLTGLKPIYFVDMDVKQDHIYEGFLIMLTVIEDAILGRPSIGLIAEDDKGDCQRVFIYNFTQNKDTQDSLGFGCRISIVNPYFRFTKDGLRSIRVDDSSSVFLHGHLTDKKRCRFCGTEKGTVPCRICKRCFYCSKLCLKRDSKELKHELVCKKRLE